MSEAVSHFVYWHDGIGMFSDDYTDDKSMPQVSGTIAVKSAFLMLFRPCEGCICLIEFQSLAMIIIRAIPLLLNSTLHFSIFCGVKSCNRSPILDNEAPGLFQAVDARHRGRP